MHATLEMVLYLLYRLPECENAPFQNDLTKEWKVSKASRYTTYQSPLSTEEPSSFYYLTQTEDASFILSPHIDY